MERHPWHPGQAQKEWHKYGDIGAHKRFWRTAVLERVQARAQLRSARAQAQRVRNSFATRWRAAHDRLHARQQPYYNRFYRNMRRVVARQIMGAHEARQSRGYRPYRGRY